MSLSTELSGVNGAQTDIDTIGNNIANVNTTGFKLSDAEFSAIYGSAIPVAPGQGVTRPALPKPLPRARSRKPGTLSTSR